MKIKYEDYNGSQSLINNSYRKEWGEVESVVSNMPLHLKPSGQSGMVGDPIFDPVGINTYFKSNLTEHGWEKKIDIPSRFQPLGKDVDFGKNGAIAEIQFSHYSFLYNNLLRSEVFYQDDVEFSGEETKLVLIVAKSKMFPASNSSLHYEQALRQLNALGPYDAFDVPLRLVGLFEDENSVVDVVWTDYGSSRSRTPESTSRKKAEILESDTRCEINLKSGGEDTSGIPEQVGLDI